MERLLNRLGKLGARDYFLLAASIFCFFLPLHRVGTSIPAQLMGLIWLFWIPKTIPTGNRRFWTILLASLFLLQIVLQAAWWPFKGLESYEVQQKLPLLLFPLCLSTMKGLDRRETHRLMSALLAGCMALLAGGLINALFKLVQSGSAGLFYLDFVSFTNLHPTYAAMFALFGLIYVWKPLLEIKNEVRMALGAALVLLVILLMARLQFILLFPLLGLIGFAELKKRMPGIGAFFITIGLLAALFGSAYLSPAVQNRIDRLFETNWKQTDKKYWESTNKRLAIWQASAELVKRHPLGVGPGHENDALHEELSRRELSIADAFWWNAHNQYLQQLLAMGIPGLMLMIWIWGKLGMEFLRENHAPGIGLMAIIMLSALTESILESQGGVMLYGFFSAVYLFRDRAEN